MGGEEKHDDYSSADREATAPPMNAPVVEQVNRQWSTPIAKIVGFVQPIASVESIVTAGVVLISTRLADW